MKRPIDSSRGRARLPTRIPSPQANPPMLNKLLKKPVLPSGGRRSRGPRSGAPRAGCRRGARRAHGVSGFQRGWVLSGINSDCGAPRLPFGGARGHARLKAVRELYPGSARAARAARGVRRLDPDLRRLVGRVRTRPAGVRSCPPLRARLRLLRDAGSRQAAAGVGAARLRLRRDRDLRCRLDHQGRRRSLADLPRRSAWAAQLPSHLLERAWADGHAGDRRLRPPLLGGAAVPSHASSRRGGGTASGLNLAAHLLPLLAGTRGGRSSSSMQRSRGRGGC